jgi:hypothetical protein
MGGSCYPARISRWLGPAVGFVANRRKRKGHPGDLIGIRGREHEKESRRKRVDGRRPEENWVLRRAVQKLGKMEKEPAWGSCKEF